MRSLSRYVLDLLLLLVGLIDTLLVCLYSFEWNTYTGSSRIEAVAFAVALTGASIVFFEYAVKYLITIKQSGKRNLLGPFVLFMLWAVIATYSMQNTTAAQFIGTERQKALYLEEHKDEINQSLLASKIENEIARLDESQKQAKTRIVAIDKTLSTANTLDATARYRSTIAALGSEKVSLQRSIDASEAKRRELLDRSLRSGETSNSLQRYDATRARDVFAFYKDVLGARSSDAVQLTLAIFKGIVLDLINILCFMFVMLRRKNDTTRDRDHDRGISEARRETIGTDEADEQYASSSESSETSGDGTDRQPLRSNERPRTSAPSSPSHRLAAYIYEAKGQSSNGTLISPRRAFDQLNIENNDYEKMVQNGLLHGVLRRRAGRIYVVPGYSQSEFEKEVRE